MPGDKLSDTSGQTDMAAESTFIVTDVEPVSLPTCHCPQVFGPTPPENILELLQWSFETGEHQGSDTTVQKSTNHIQTGLLWLTPICSALLSPPRGGGGGSAGPFTGGHAVSTVVGEPPVVPVDWDPPGPRCQQTKY